MRSNRRHFINMTASAASAVLLGGRSQAAVPCNPGQVRLDGDVIDSGACTIVNQGEDAISRLASGLAPGQSSTALGDSGLSQPVAFTIQWENRFFYDSVRRRAHLIGKNASSQGSQRSNCLYDATTNRWTGTLYGGSELGHVYESFAFDPGAGEIYTGTWGSSAIKKWSPPSVAGNWTEVAPPYSGSMTGGVQPPLCWHPNLFGPSDGGLLAIAGSSNTSTVVAWRKATGTWSVVPGLQENLSGDYPQYGVIEYVRSGDYCIVAFDVSKGGRTFRVPAGVGGSLASAVTMANVPMKCGYVDQGNVGILIDSPIPSGAPYVLEKGGGRRVWKYVGGSWVLQPYTHPFQESSNHAWVVAAIYPYRAFWAQDNNASSPSIVWAPNS